VKARFLTTEHVITKYGDLEPITAIERDKDVYTTDGRFLGRVAISVTTDKGSYGYDLDEDVPTLQD
jgi:hypothetical protein